MAHGYLMNSPQRQLKYFGGAEGIRNRSGLESAIEVPKSTFDGQDLYPTTFLKAAASKEELAALFERLTLDLTDRLIVSARGWPNEDHDNSCQRFRTESARKVLGQKVVGSNPFSPTIGTNPRVSAAGYRSTSRSITRSLR
jgi:hypothetical protein